MKKNLLTIFIIFFASISNALIADKFKCSIEIKDFKTKSSSKQDKEFFIARLPLSSNTSPHVRLTTGQTLERMTLNTPEAQLGANLNFYYKHAIRETANGLQDARQLTCIGLTTDYCKLKSHNGHSNQGHGIIGTCGMSIVNCIDPNNPFDPNNGWAQTTVSDDYTPHFNEQTLAPTSRDIIDEVGNTVGVVNLNCQSLGTFN